MFEHYSMDIKTRTPLWAKLILLARKMVGHRMTFGDHAALVGAGPCKRCVGKSVSGGPQALAPTEDAP